MSKSTVQIKNLQLPYLISAYDVWNRYKEQPGVLSISVELKRSFDGNADSLNDSIHYGNLAKEIRKYHGAANNTIRDVLEAIQKMVFEMGSKSDGDNAVLRMETQLRLPKASMTGDEISFTWVSKVNDGRLVFERTCFSVPNMRLMSLIGVNDHEREAKQPIVASFDLEYFTIEGENGEQSFPEEYACLIERDLAKLIEESDFQTLEALADHSVKQLAESFYEHSKGKAAIRLRLEKPKAIPFADAAVVEHFVPA